MKSPHCFAGVIKQPLLSATTHTIVLVIQLIWGSLALDLNNLRTGLQLSILLSLLTVGLIGCFYMEVLRLCDNYWTKCEIEQFKQNKKKEISFKEKFSVEDILLNNYPFGEIFNFTF